MERVRWLTQTGQCERALVSSPVGAESSPLPSTGTQTCGSGRSWETLHTEQPPSLLYSPPPINIYLPPI